MTVSVTTSIAGDASTSSAGAGLAWLSTTRDDAADDPRLDTIVFADQARIETGLPSERRGKLRIANIDADDAPAVEAAGEQIVGVFGLVAAMECADPDMRHAGRQRGTIVSRLLHGLR